MATSLLYIMPFLAFLFVFVVSYALFSKTRVLGESQVTNVLVSFLIAVMFLVNPPATKFTLATIPWIAVLMVVLLFILMILTMVRGKIEDIVQSQIVALILVAAILLVFLAAAVNVFGPLIASISAGNLNPVEGTAAQFVFNPALAGAAILIVISLVSYYFLIKK